MKTMPFRPAYVKFLAVMVIGLSGMMPLYGQITPPGYEREMQLRESRSKISMMERDSITMIDTSLVFDPATYQEETVITRTRYSLKDYCRDVLGMRDPNILLDGKPHTILNPETFEDLIIRLNVNAGKIDTIPR